MRNTVLGLLFALIPAAVAAAEPPLASADLRALVATHVKARPADEFTAPPDESRLVGRVFELTVPFGKEFDSNNSGGWDYDPSSGVLKLRPEVERFDIRILDGRFDGYVPLENSSRYGLYFSYFDKAAGSYVGETAFGVRRRVDNLENGGLAVVAQPDQIGSPGLGEKTVPMPPEEARSVTRHLVLVISGTLALLHSKSVFGCGRSSLDATIDDPVRLETRFCLVGASIRDVQVRDATTGHVLADWF